MVEILDKKLILPFLRFLIASASARGREAEVIGNLIQFLSSWFLKSS